MDDWGQVRKGQGYVEVWRGQSDCLLVALWIVLQLITSEMALFQRKRRYSRISYEKRLSLIEMIDNENMTISRAAKKLHIKLPTAKVILSNYRKKGKIFNKKIEQLEQEDSKSPIQQEGPVMDPPVMLFENPITNPPLLYYYVYYPSITSMQTEP